MRCAETVVILLPDSYNQAARDALAHPSPAACGSRPISGNGPGGRWVRGQSLAFLGNQPWPEVSTKTPATDKRARPMRSPATDASGRPPFPKACGRWSRHESTGKGRLSLCNSGLSDVPQNRTVSQITRNAVIYATLWVANRGLIRANRLQRLPSQVSSLSCFRQVQQIDHRFRGYTPFALPPPAAQQCW